ncbi:hypothetical protein ILYODFUR_019608 [Ilyodon furcidens]|uniref:DUF4174 domain-containing protein n=1 Tax=Ilyodon furcidens TaxID=33524 RepID=A0ABV0VGL0_9TELE
MLHLYTSHHLVLLVALWSLSCTGLIKAWPGTPGSKPGLDPNVRDWGDYSDLPAGVEYGLGLEEDREHEDNRGSSNLAPELDFLADFAGKKRLWVITALSHNDNYLRMMEKQLEDMYQKGLNCRLAERDTFIITVIQNAMMEGRIQKTTFQGDATVENLDPETVTKLLHYLELSSQEQTFTMLVMKKNLQVSDRFPYPVRVEAILELIDQFPLRKLEKMTRKGSTLRYTYKYKGSGSQSQAYCEHCGISERCPRMFEIAQSRNKPDSGGGALGRLYVPSSIRSQTPLSARPLSALKFCLTFVSIPPFTSVKSSQGFPAPCVPRPSPVNPPRSFMVILPSLSVKLLMLGTVAPVTYTLWTEKDMVLRTALGFAVYSSWILISSGEAIEADSLRQMPHCFAP